MATNETIRVYNGANRYAVLSDGGPHKLGGLSLLLEPDEPARIGAARHAREFRLKAAQLLAWADRIDRALKNY